MDPLDALLDEVFPGARGVLIVGAVDRAERAPAVPLEQVGSGDELVPGALWLGAPELAREAAERLASRVVGGGTIVLARVREKTSFARVRAFLARASDDLPVVEVFSEALLLAGLAEPRLLREDDEITAVAARVRATS
jgi:hypothetical protein